MIYYEDATYIRKQLCMQKTKTAMDPKELYFKSSSV
jgi:hypothetical protein